MASAKNGELQIRPPSNVLQLNQTDSIDLSGLSEGQISELKIRHAEGIADLKKKALEMQIDVAALDANLTSFNTQTERAMQSGHSATIQHSQTTSIGRTEVIIGNTEHAAGGRLSRSATGRSGCAFYTVLVVVIIILTVIFIG